MAAPRGPVARFTLDSGDVVSIYADGYDSEEYASAIAVVISKGGTIRGLNAYGHTAVVPSSRIVSVEVGER